MPVHRRLVVCAFALGSACDATSTPRVLEWTSLVDHDAWVVGDALSDPLPDHRPAVVHCEQPFAREREGIEVSTRVCDYASLSQPLLLPVEAGDPLAVRAWWYPLASEAPAQGHVALLVGDVVLWEEHVEIPGPAAIRDLEIASPVSFDAGETLTLHVHNHGYNDWIFERLDALEQE